MFNTQNALSLYSQWLVGFLENGGKISNIYNKPFNEAAFRVVSRDITDIKAGYDKTGNASGINLKEELKKRGQLDEKPPVSISEIMDDAFGEEFPDPQCFVVESGIIVSPKDNKWGHHDVFWMDNFASSRDGFAPLYPEVSEFLKKAGWDFSVEEFEDDVLHDFFDAHPESGLAKNYVKIFKDLEITLEAW